MKMGRTGTGYILLIILLLLLLVMLCYSCRELTRDPVREFIPGIYIRFSQHEFGHEYDTLVITPQNKSAGEYAILRKWKYERVLDGIWLEPEYKRTKTTGLYNTQHKLLRETESGSIYNFDVTEKILFNGPVKYQKL
mgnify:CR=1 FL=1